MDQATDFFSLADLHRQACDGHNRSGDGQRQTAATVLDSPVAAIQDRRKRMGSAWNIRHALVPDFSRRGKVVIDRRYSRAHQLTQTTHDPDTHRAPRPVLGVYGDEELYFSSQAQHLDAKGGGKPEPCFGLQAIQIRLRTADVFVTTITRFLRNELRQGLVPASQG